MQTSLIERLAAWRGIQPDYVDAWGKPASVDVQSKARILAAMGYPIDDDAAVEDMMAAEVKHVWTRVLPPVQVHRQNDTYQLVLYVPQPQANQQIRWQLTTEQHHEVAGQFTPLDGQLQESRTFDGEVYQRYSVTIAAKVPWGYHQLQLTTALNDPIATSRFIVTPQACYKPNAIAAGRRVWGPAVQLYCLRSEQNWGVGDFSDLQQLVSGIAERGGDFVGLNPIHALYPANPESCSPYSPSSRRWLNVIYIDVTAVPEFALSSAAQSLVEQPQFQQQLAELRAKDWVDYSGVMACKLAALRPVFATFVSQHLAANTERAQAFKKFADAGGESLREQATYDALAVSFQEAGKPCWGWPAWPEEYRSFYSPKVQDFARKHAEEVQFFIYLQWLADEQLKQVADNAKEQGMLVGLYRDLAVGVSEGSTEVWANSEIYRADAAVGAPPDILGPLGQNWGLPPMDPMAVLEQGYQPFIDLFRSNMRHSGALRIDHVMSLLRLWWVPKGEDAKEGAYVRYPINDLLGILALESHRNKAMVIGEDLGTVPEGIFETLQDAGVHSYRVFFFERSKQDGGFLSPEDYPEQAMATIGTHDMPTLQGYWEATDLSLGKKLGLYQDEVVLNQLYEDRADAKQRILDSLHGKESIPPFIPRRQEDVSMTRDLNYGMQTHLAYTASSLLALQVEDWLEMAQPVNVPGTSDEYPNWRRKLSATVDEIFSRPEIDELLTTVSAVRRSVSTDASLT